jgi:hypothetical protein
VVPELRRRRNVVVSAGGRCQSVAAAGGALLRVLTCTRDGDGGAEACVGSWDARGATMVEPPALLCRVWHGAHAGYVPRWEVGEGNLTGLLHIVLKTWGGQLIGWKTAVDGVGKYIWGLPDFLVRTLLLCECDDASPMEERAWWTQARWHVRARAIAEELPK